MARDVRTVNRLMQAASQVETAGAREACVLGAIVRCFVETGHFRPEWVQHFVPESLHHFKKDIAKVGERVDLRGPTKVEVRAALAKLMDKYDPPGDARAATAI